MVVSVPAFYSDYPSSNPAGYMINFLYEKTKINEKEARIGPLKKYLINCWITLSNLTNTRILIYWIETLSMVKC